MAVKVPYVSYGINLSIWASNTRTFKHAHLLQQYSFFRPLFWDAFYSFFCIRHLNWAASSFIAFFCIVFQYARTKRYNTLPSGIQEPGVKFWYKINQPAPKHCVPVRKPAMRNSLPRSGGDWMHHASRLAISMEERLKYLVYQVAWYLSSKAW